MDSKTFERMLKMKRMISLEDYNILREFAARFGRQDELPRPLDIKGERMYNILISQGWTLLGRYWRHFSECKGSLQSAFWKPCADPSHCSSKKCRKRHQVYCMVPPDGISRTQAKKIIAKGGKK